MLCARAKYRAFCFLLLIHKPAAVLTFDNIPAREFSPLGEREIHAANAPVVVERHENGEDFFLAFCRIFFDDFGRNFLR